MDKQTKTHLLELARKAAFKAGETHLKYYQKDKEISHKLNQFDLVTNADKEAEALILETIRSECPTHSILAEESDITSGNPDFLWVIDPLDGTTNYAHNFPQFCVSICLMYKGELFVGIVYDALKKELFEASKGDGALLNGQSIQVSTVKTVAESLLSTGFPYVRTQQEFNNLNYFETFMYKSQAIRRPGSAALDLCYLACGRYDGFWELKLSPWDTAAGALIVQEAGGIVTNFFSDSFSIYKKHILATNKHIYDEMHQIIQQTNPHFNT